MSTDGPRGLQAGALPGRMLPWAKSSTGSCHGTCHQPVHQNGRPLASDRAGHLAAKMARSPRQVIMDAVRVHLLFGQRPRPLTVTSNRVASGAGSTSSTRKACKTASPQSASTSSSVSATWWQSWIALRSSPGRSRPCSLVPPIASFEKACGSTPSPSLSSAQSPLRYLREMVWSFMISLTLVCMLTYLETVESGRAAPTVRGGIHGRGLDRGTGPLMRAHLAKRQISPVDREPDGMRTQAVRQENSSSTTRSGGMSLASSASFQMHEGVKWSRDPQTLKLSPCTGHHSRVPASRQPGTSVHSEVT